ncbi:hypothetical protein NQK81_00480 [Amycolatopsis roodepoortensis]|uniref:hypothetical protein n=1 Tax=Amycolatopsis roodepoortensis TaxID=700274 RepID=UPI00214CCB87|nr:hypothetical protein [Amycolatopsis roodepoortensis]UUV31955.1 hypothetical protein NQK81_00480 [Amycolatopsis roodepoortensis]
MTAGPDVLPVTPGRGSMLWAGRAQHPRKWFPEYTVMIIAIGMAAVLIVFGHPGSALPFYAGMLLAFGVFSSSA